MSSTLKPYELTYILGEKTQQEDGQKKLVEIEKLIVSLGGKKTKAELWGRRELAYEIAKNRTGFYTTIWFDFDPSQLKALNQDLNFDESVIRSLITIAVEYSQPGSLYPVAEPEKGNSKDEKASAEAMLRMGSTSKAKKEVTPKEEIVEDLPEDERLKKLDEKLDELLNEEEA